jgi:hypothetical protein
MKGKSDIAVRLDITSSSVAIAYQCTWSDNLWRFRWDVDGKTHRSELAFPGDHGFPTFYDAIRAAVELGFRCDNVLRDFRSKR